MCNKLCNWVLQIFDKRVQLWMLVVLWPVSELPESGRYVIWCSQLDWAGRL